MENLEIFYGRLVYFEDICFILLPFDVCLVHLLLYPHFDIMYQEHLATLLCSNFLRPQTSGLPQKQEKNGALCNLYFFGTDFP
jgi:hypothetical protein